MDKLNPSTKKLINQNKLVGWWYRRTNFERNLFLSLIITTLFLSVILIYITVHVAVTKQICSTFACLKAATQIATYVDESADPCDDFFKFACGKSNNLNSMPLAKLQKHVQEELDELIKKPAMPSDHYAVKLQKELIKSCLGENRTQQIESLNIFKNLLNVLGGWPVIVGDDWNETLFNWRDMTYKLRQKGYFYKMMLDIGIVIDPNDNTKIIVGVYSPNSLLNDDYNRHNYINYMTEIVTMLGADKQIAELEMEKVYDFMGRFKKLINKSMKGETETESIIATVEEFQNEYHKWDWLGFLNNILAPSATVTYQDKIMFPTREFMKGFLNIIYKIPKRTQANYMFWKVFQNIQLFLPKEFRQSYTKYTFATQGEASPKEQLKTCMKKINNLFLPEPNDILYIRKQLPLRKRRKIQNLFNMVKSEFKKHLNGVSWMDEFSKKKALEKADALHSIIGGTDIFFNDSIFEQFEFIKNRNENDNPLNLYSRRYKDQVDALYSQIHKPLRNDAIAAIHHLLSMATALYVANHNTMLLTAGILQGIFYDEERPTYLNFGAIGSIIGHELTHGFCKRGSNYNKHGREEKMWTCKTEDAYQEKAKCFIKNADEFLLNNVTNQINGVDTIEENIADYTGLKIAYAAYESWIDQNGEEPYLTGIPYSPRQLFWISAVAYHCYNLDERLTKIFLKRDQHALNIFRATEPLRNNKDFSRDFNCPLGSRMNPLEKCQIF